MKKRLDMRLVRPDKRIAEGYYSDEYFNRTRKILTMDNRHPIVRMQFFQKNDDVCIAGIDEAIANIRMAVGDDFDKLTIKALYDGDLVSAFETVMLVEGDYAVFPHIETVALGPLARRTKVATNVYRTVREATQATAKPVLFFCARFDIPQVQAGDGYAYDIALQSLGFDGNRGGYGVSTNAQGEWWGSKALGTIPHSLIAAYNGDTVTAALKFAEFIEPEVKRIVLVDYENDCVKTTLEVADAMLEKYLATQDSRYKLFSVRLDTSDTVVDKSLINVMGQFNPTGVNEKLVWNVYHALKERAAGYPKGSTEHSFYEEVGIIVSGGFDAGKIKRFESARAPVIGYGVGSKLYSGNFDFTADIVSVQTDGQWRENAKTGRGYRPNPRLDIVS